MKIGRSKRFAASGAQSADAYLPSTVDGMELDTARPGVYHAPDQGVSGVAGGLPRHDVRPDRG
jgi:hypothetical protein